MIALAKDHRFVLLATIVLLALLLDIMAPVFTEGFDDDHPIALALIGSLIGVVIAQLNLISVWAALAPGRVILRLPWSLVLVVLMWYALIIGNAIINEAEDAAPFLGAMLLCGYVSTQVPLWVATRFSGWRLFAPNQFVYAGDQGRQFSIREMIFGTTVLAIVISLGRLIVPLPLDFTEVWRQRELHVITGALMGCNLLLVVPCIWGAFQPVGRFGALAIGWFLLILLVSVGEVAVLFSLLGAGPELAKIILVFLSINLGQCTAAFMVMLLLRMAGYRLRQTRNVVASHTVTEYPFAS